MPIPMIAAMAAAGLLKGMADKKKEDNERRQAAEMARWSAWTGMAPNKISTADPIGSTLQGAMAGAQMQGAGGAAKAAAVGSTAAAAPAAADQVPMQSAQNAPAAAPMQGSTFYGQSAGGMPGGGQGSGQYDYSTPWGQMGQPSYGQPYPTR